MCGECETWNNIIYSETEAVKPIIIIKGGTEYAQTNLWNNSNNILGTDLSRILYNESVREEILSYIKIQLADGISNINSEVLTFIITQQLSEKNGSGE